MADPSDTDPAEKNPSEKGLERRSGMPAASPWVVAGALLMLGGLVYLVSALL